MLICTYGVKNWGLVSKRVWHMISTFFSPSRTIESALESSVSSLPFRLSLLFSNPSVFSYHSSPSFSVYFVPFFFHYIAWRFVKMSEHIYFLFSELLMPPLTYYHLHPLLLHLNNRCVLPYFSSFPCLKQIVCF